MPTVLRWAGHRAYFVTHDCREPAHVHVDRQGCSGKVWLERLDVARNIGFADHELSGIVRHLRNHRGELLRMWDEHCGRATDRGPRT